MKKILIISILCILNFQIFAQEKENIIGNLESINVGQSIPDVSINNLINYAKKSDQTVKLSDFKGKLLIIDFWATWCSPCVAMIPKMDSLQTLFGDRIQFLSVTYQDKKEVLPFLQKLEASHRRKYSVPFVTNDQLLNKLFPHVYLPHYVWIDRDGIVRAITESKDLTAENIKKMLDGGTNLSQKKDEVSIYDYKQSLSRNLQNRDWKPMFSSTLTGYMEGFGGGSSVRMHNPNSRSITLVNSSLLWLYRAAYQGKGALSKARIRIETIDRERFTSTLKGAAFRNWLRSGNGFCYEIQGQFVSRADLFKKMQQDLTDFFPQYEAKMEIIDMEVYSLIRTSSSDKLKSKNGPYQSYFNIHGVNLQNTFLIEFMYKLTTQYQQSSQIPFIDNTGYLDKIDLSIDANLSDVNDMNKALAKYDLKFLKVKLPIEVLVIKDNLLYKVEKKM